jgi:glucose/arabinose dehydrogenase
MRAFADRREPRDGSALICRRRRRRGGPIVDHRSRRSSHSSHSRRSRSRTATTGLVAALLAFAFVLPETATALSRRATVAPVASGAASMAGAAVRAATAAVAGRALRDGAVAAAETRARPAAATGPAIDAFDPTKVDLHLTLFKSGLSSPVLVTNAGDGSGRLFVVEQTGRIRVITAGGTLLSKPFLDIHSLITTGGERGLLGLAFHPRFETNGYLYIYFTNSSGDIAINRYRAAPGANVVTSGSGVRILTIDHPFSNHNGGNMAFGPDNYLYIGTGDGGGAGDPGNRAQSVNSLLGKMLRIDVDHTSTGKRYRAPSTNPYVGRTGLDEIWSRGLRNPWRWSFDMPTRRLFIGDVGQNRYEEVDRALPSGTTPGGRGVNFGWRVMEGRACYSPPSGCSTSGKQPPLIVYGHAVAGTDNCSITGGFVYRGTGSPVLTGGYVYGDFCSGRIWVADPVAHTPATGRLVRGPGGINISSFGVDEAGELYLTDLGGSIYRISAD